MADLADIRIGIDVETGDVARAVQMFESFKRKTAQLKLELNKGNITKKAYNRSIQQMGAQLGKVTGNTNQAKSAMMKYRLAIENATDEQLKFTTASGKGMRRMEILAQQAGYQIGDLAVQIQSGTNAAVALGQQGSQLLGFFGPTGAIAGAVLAIGTGLIAPFLKAKDTIKDTTKEIESLRLQIDLIKFGFKDEKSFQLTIDIETARKKIDEFKANISKLKLVPSDTSAVQVVKYLEAIEYQEGLIKSAMDELKVRADLTTEYMIQEDKLKKLESSHNDLTSAANAYSKANEEISEERAKELDLLSKIANTNPRIKKEQDALVSSAKAYSLINGQILQEKVEELELLSRIANTNPKIRKEQDALVSAAKAYSLINGQILLEKAEELELYERQFAKQDTINDLLHSELKYGKDSAKYKALQNSLQDEQLKKEIELLKLSDTKKKILVSLVNEQRTLLDQLDEEEEKRKRIADLIISPALAAKGAGYAALSGELALRQATGLGVVEDKTDKKTKAKESMASIIKGMEEQANLQRQIVGLSDQEADYLQILYNLKEQNKTASGKMTEAQLKQAADRIAAINAETAAMEAQMQKVQDVADSIESNFGDALMGIVTDFDILNSSIEDFGYHAEQVFKNMAREIIKELYRIFVVKKITGFVEGAITGTYADLGRVGAPSMDGGGYTGSGPRSGGLDGKGGFLAMLHPRETVIDHTKGQSGGVTIQQNFNFSANGDECVKRMIAQAAPQIAKMTERGIMDSRRRGGQMKAVFG